jgi:hypothetical protein
VVKPAIPIFLGAFDIALVGLSLAAGSAATRRPDFWRRLLIGCLVLPGVLMAVMGAAALQLLTDGMAKVLLPFVLLIMLATLMFVPALLYERAGPPSDGSDGGGGSGPDEPSAPPAGPRGGIPLPDAQQARLRVRDHTAPTLHGGVRRRRVSEPERTPVTPA